jgi:hypothetical protein
LRALHSISAPLQHQLSVDALQQTKHGGVDRCCLDAAAQLKIGFRDGTRD